LCLIRFYSQRLLQLAGGFSESRDYPAIRSPDNINISYIIIIINKYYRHRRRRFRNHRRRIRNHRRRRRFE